MHSEENAKKSCYKILSDFDDTFKRSNIPNKGLKTLANVPLYHKAYVGMSTLFKELEKNSNGLYVVSASPSVLRGLIEKSLNSYEVPFRQTFTRGVQNLGFDRKEKFKTSVAESLLEDNNDTLILLGDDVELDHKIYLRIKEKYPDRIGNIYIRKVINRKPRPNGVTYFITAFDIAIQEYHAGRLTRPQVGKIASEILSLPDSKMEELIPDYSFCPTSTFDFPNIEITGLETLREVIQNKIIIYCLSKRK